MATSGTDPADRTNVTDETGANVPGGTGGASMPNLSTLRAALANFSAAAAAVMAEAERLSADEAAAGTPEDAAAAVASMDARVAGVERLL